jgi:hypothetical protein
VSSGRDILSDAISVLGDAGDQTQRLTAVLSGVRRCPYCSVADPHLAQVWVARGATSRGDGGVPSKWAAYACSSCGSLVVAVGTPGQTMIDAKPHVAGIFPSARVANPALPEIARRFLQQAMDTLHAPDAAAVMAGSAVDAMLKASGYEKGTLYERIDKALTDQLLTRGMADWAHSVRLGSNRPRHADKDSPHVSPEDARRSVDFAEALGNFLFVLTAQIEEATAAVTSPAV